MPRIVKWLLVLAVAAAVFGASAYLTMTLIIRAEKTVVVPDLIAGKVVRGLKTLSDLGLNTRVQGFAFSDDIPADRVVFQDPDPGTEIKAGRDVRIVISMGSRKIPAPDLAGLPIQQARILLEENDLCLKQMARAYSAVRARDGIIAQFPSAGRIIERKDCLDLLVSLGPRPPVISMPALTALPLDEAILALEQQGLSMGSITTEFSHKAPENTVVGQTPGAGHRTARGTVVHLVVQRSRTAAGAGMAQPVSVKPGARLFRHRVPSGFLKRHIRIHLTRPWLAMDLFDGFLEPGEEVWFLIPRGATTTVLLYEDKELTRTEIFDGRRDSLHE
jgi:eukaryotic-like serine/threonine-protein kinase